MACEPVSLLQERMADPPNLGKPEGTNAQASIGNPACGDVLTLWLRIDDDRITAAGFDSIGSPFQLATASVLCDCVTGQLVAQARARTPHCVLDRLPELPRRHHYLARLAVDALNRALDAFGGAMPQTDDGRAVLGEGEAEAFVRAYLQVAPQTTMELDQKFLEAAVAAPGGVARMLSNMKAAGTVNAELDLDSKAWRWSLAS